LRDFEVELVDMNKIRHLLRTSQAIWSRQGASSKEARKAVAALNYILGDSGVRPEPHMSEVAPPSSATATAAPFFPG
jgi:hypothetical protein